MIINQQNKTSKTSKQIKCIIVLKIILNNNPGMVKL